MLTVRVMEIMITVMMQMLSSVNMQRIFSTKTHSCKNKITEL